MSEAPTFKEYFEQREAKRAKFKGIISAALAAANLPADTIVTEITLAYKDGAPMLTVNHIKTHAPDMEPGMRIDRTETQVWS